MSDDFLRPTRIEADRDAAEDARAFQAEVAPVSIRCAHCKGRHGSADEVAACAAEEAHGRAEAEADAAWEAATDVAYARSREAIAERGTWFGPVTEADSWGEE
jgi:hypothetical protein